MHCWCFIAILFLLRETEKELVLTCKLDFDIKFAYENLAYKYVVISESDVFFENLDSTHKRNGDPINRCLRIVPDSQGEIYIYCQFKQTMGNVKW